jgi:DNA-binding MarR family transcriptional regulator
VAGEPDSEAAARELAVVLHDLAWLLPRTLDAAVEERFDALPASELEIMRLLVRRPGLSVGEVAAELALQKTNVSASVRILVARGLLERRRDAADGRLVRLRPTRRAIAIREAREAAWGVALEEHLSRLPQRDAARALRAAGPLRRLVAELAAAAER